GQHHHHRAEAYVPGAAGHVGQELHHVRAHRVVSEVMLHRPDRFETKRLGHIGQRQLVQVDLAIRELAAGVLEDGSQSDMHGRFLAMIAFMVNAHSYSWKEHAGKNWGVLESAPIGRHTQSMRSVLAGLAAFVALILVATGTQAQTGVPEIENYINSIRTAQARFVHSN